MPRIRRTFLPLLLFSAGLFSACSAIHGPEAAERAVEEFRARYEQEQFEEIYAEADPSFRQSGSKSDYLQFMEAVRRKLGRVKASERMGLHTNVSPSGTQVILTYRTEFEEGTGEEQFVWRVTGDEAKLLGYNINSPVLVIR